MNKRHPHVICSFVSAGKSIFLPSHMGTQQKWLLCCRCSSSLVAIHGWLHCTERNGEKRSLSYICTGWVWEIKRFEAIIGEDQLSLRNNWRLKLKTAGKLPIILEEFDRIFFNLIKENRRMSTCNWLDLQTLVSQPMIMPTDLPGHWFKVIKTPGKITHI